MPQSKSSQVAKAAQAALAALTLLLMVAVQKGNPVPPMQWEVLAPVTELSSFA